MRNLNCTIQVHSLDVYDGNVSPRNWNWVWATVHSQLIITLFVLTMRRVNAMAYINYPHESRTQQTNHWMSKTCSPAPWLTWMWDPKYKVRRSTRDAWKMWKVFVHHPCKRCLLSQTILIGFHICMCVCRHVCVSCTSFYCRLQHWNHVRVNVFKVIVCVLHQFSRNMLHAHANVILHYLSSSFFKFFPSVLLPAPVHVTLDWKSLLLRCSIILTIALRLYILSLVWKRLGI